ncbi:hypothetical protein HOU00_gp295 [Caulobacter phage CcrPW]|uniref:Uncharacterized protein n=1 Tax=Caulobacter phage CcrPW TaxID=2283271 RepID=A0A385EAZ8_9CAUD|nr:hypothetical protein HOU00_gp295 [Caulobacter phage CcrPW]AXQ68830.1 hypothetical protein CcrPW_gp291 [Caulobacter phage CcrPW]
MGMYTELVLSTQIVDNPDVVAILNYMREGGEGEPPVPLPDHPLFQTPRWSSLFCCCSYYFTPTTVFKLEFDKIAKAWSLVSRSDLKNYHDEIEKFVDWISPYLDDHFGQMIGYKRYEEEREPTILYAPGGEVDPS